MKRTVSQYLATILAKNHHYRQTNFHHSTPFFEAGTPHPPVWQGLKNSHSFCTHPHQLHGKNKVSHTSSHMFVMQRLFSAQPTTEDENMPLESEMRKRVGWLIKVLAAVTITYVSFNMFPIMGDSLIWQSVALVRLDDPFMKRSGASRISMIATNDRRRKNFVEAGGVTELAKMLESAPDDKTRLEAVKALVSLCECDVAVEALHTTGAEGLLKSLAQESSSPDVKSQSLALLKTLKQWKGGAK
eukprot:c21596_g1_i1 orf=255-986(+)